MNSQFRGVDAPATTLGASVLAKWLLVSDVVALLVVWLVSLSVVRVVIVVIWLILDEGGGRAGPSHITTAVKYVQAFVGVISCIEVEIRVLYFVFLACE